MGLRNQLSNVVEWQQEDEELLFWKWSNQEIKKGSRLILRPGQDAVFLYNGKIEGVFRDEGSFDIESEIIPFLSSLKGFRFGFNSGIRAEVLFVNTKELTVKWGTKNAIQIPAAGLPGGLPIRAFGTFSCKVADYALLLEKIAGVRTSFGIGDVKERVVSKLDTLLMKWISSEGKDLFHLQAYAGDISRGIASDLDYEMHRIGIGITDFVVSSFSYPEEIQKMAEKAASQAMVGDMARYQQMAMADALAKGGSSAAGEAAGLGLGLAMGQQMAGQMLAQSQQAGGTNPSPQAAAEGGLNFCPNCGTRVSGMKFCSNCGMKLM